MVTSQQKDRKKRKAATVPKPIQEVVLISHVTVESFMLSSVPRSMSEIFHPLVGDSGATIQRARALKGI